MSSSKLITAKNSSPICPRGAFSISSHAQSISRISQISQNKQSLTPTKSRPQNSASFQARHLFNLMNMTTEDARNTSTTSFLKSPLTKNVSFSQAKHEMTRKGSQQDSFSVSNQQYSLNRKSLIYNDTTINSDISETIMQEDIRYLRHPSPSFKGQHLLQGSKEFASKKLEEPNFLNNTNNPDKACKSTRVSKGGEPVNGIKSMAGVMKKTAPKLSEQSQKRGEIQRTRNDGKGVGYNAVSFNKDRPRVQGRNSISSSQVNMSMVTLKKGPETDRSREVIDPKPILRNSHAQNHNHGHSQSQISKSIIVESNAKEVLVNEGMDMKSLIHDNRYVQDSRDKKFVLPSPRGAKEGVSLSNLEETPLKTQESLIVKKVMALDLKPVLKQNKAHNHSRSQNSGKSIMGLESGTRDVPKIEGMDMKALINNSSYVQDSRDKVSMRLTIPSPRGGANGTSNGNHDESPLQQVYNDLLNKKFGGVPQKNSMGASTIMKNPNSPRNEKKEKNSSAANMYHSILDSILNKKKPNTKKKSDNSELESVKKTSSNISTSREHVKSQSVSLTIMKQVPRGVLVKRTDRKNSANEPEPSTDRKRNSKDLNATFDLTKSFHTIRTMGTMLVQDGASERNDLCTDRSKDYSSVQSPVKVNSKCFKKSKSVLVLCGDPNSPDKKTRRRANAVAASPFSPSPRGLRYGASFERSASSRRAKKEEKMDIKSLKVRKENKEFVDLLNKISKNISAPETKELFGQEEEALVKDLVDFIQAQELAAKEVKPHETKILEDRMSELEKKWSKVKAKIPSLQGLHLLGDSVEDNSPMDLDVSRDTLKVSPRVLSTTNWSASLKKSSFLLESTKNNGKPVKIEFDASSVEDMQSSEQAKSVVLEKGGIETQEESGEPVTPKLGGGDHKIDFREETVAKKMKSMEDEEEEEKVVSVKKEEKIYKGDLKEENIENSETLKKKNPLAIDIPVISFTQESTSSNPSLLTVAVETPTTSMESNQQENLQANAANPLAMASHKQDSVVTVANIEPKMNSPVQTFNFLSPNSTNKLESVFLKRQASPSHNAKLPVLSPRTDSISSSNTEESTHGQIIQNNHLRTSVHKPIEEASSNKDTPKLGGLASLVFRTAPPSHPAHSAHSTNEGHLSLSTLVNIKKKLKPVYIEKLAPENLKETIYENIYDKEHPGVSFGDIHDLFENAPLQRAAPAVQQVQPVKKEKCIVPDAKRAQNISILAMKFRKFSLKDFREAIVNLDPTVMTAETCSTLLPFCPLPEEIKACQDCKEPLEKLDTASQFMMHIYDIPQFGARLRSLIFKSEFKERLDVVQTSINCIKQGCDILRSNVHFRVFLRLSLEVANTLNEGTIRGSAVGIKPASLLSFDTVRSNKPGLTLLVYMVQKIYEQKREILDFTDDFNGINEATKINIEDPIRSLQEIKKEVNQLRLQLEMSLERNPPDFGFHSAFKEFYDSVAPLVVEAEEKANYAKNHYMETAKFLGEDDESLKKKTSAEFFKVFKHLADTVKKFKAEEEEKRKRVARRNAVILVKKQ